MDNKILQEFEQANAILKGHFILSSGLHSDTYLQCARVLMDPQRSERLCKMLVDKINDEFPKNAFDLVVSPAMGGVIVGYEVARQMGIEAIFCERVNGEFNLRRGFDIPKDSNILVIEDVLTTGKSSLETFTCIRNYNGNIKAEACLVDRSDAKAELGVPLISLLELKVTNFTKDNIPEHLKNIPAIKPGSRFI